MGPDLLLLVLGLALLIGGGEALVRGASALAFHFGVSPLVVGLTVVAFGTSAPELAVNVVAALRGNGDLSFGNIIGSNIANIGLVIGLTAMLRPVSIPLPIITREIPMMTLAAVVGIALGFDAALGQGRAAGPDGFDRGDGAVLLLFFCVFLYYTVSEALGQRATIDKHELPGRTGLGTAVLLTAIGFLGLIGGGRLTVDAATGLARALGMSEALIGMTIVAVGTSLPELVTSIVSVLRGQSDLAVGNVVGSNIFNLLFVLGVTSGIAEVPVPAGGHEDLLIVAGLSALMLPLSINRKRTVPRAGGVLLFAAYVGYITWRTLAGG